MDGAARQAAVWLEDEIRMATVHSAPTLDALEGMAPEELLAWAFSTHGDRAAIMTSFQNTGCVLIDMASRVVPGFRVATLDTLRLHEETYDIMRRVEARYGVPVERFEPEPARVRKMVAQHGEFLFFDSKPKQEYCCNIRKVEPRDRALETLDVWITGLRHDQSSARKAVPKASEVDIGGRRLLKLSPLVDWTEDAVWRYIRAHDVPYNALYDQGYTSIGCQICTTPTRPGEDKRAGRWRWFNALEDAENKECGIHIGGSGI